MQSKFNEIRNKMIKKWMQIPFAILVVLVTGACYNLFAYFQMIGAAQGYGGTTMTIIKYTVLFGYFLGLIPGYIVRAIDEKGGFIVAAIMSLISMSVLGYLANNGEGSTFEWFIMILFLFTGAMSGSIAVIAAIVTPVKSFPYKAGTLILVIMIGYYKIAPYFEFSVRSAFFEDPDLMWYFIGVGVIQAIVFLIGAFAIDEVDLGAKAEEVMEKYDVMGLLIYVLLSVLLFASFWIVALIYENWFIGCILFLSFVLLNFIAVAASFGIVYASFDVKDLLKGGGNKVKRNEVLFEKMLGEPKYICLVFASLFVVGIGMTFNFNIMQISFAYGLADSADNLLDTFWGASMFGRVGGGLIAYFFADQINGYHFAIGGAVSAALGFGITILTGPAGDMFLFIGSVLIAFGTGIYWVIVPAIVMDDAGEKNFGLNWGLTLFANAFGMFAFGEMYDWIYEWQGDGAATCSGGNCNLIQFIVFGLFGLAAAGLAWLGLQKDQETKGADKGAKGGKGDKKSGKGKDKGGKDRGRSKSKDGKSSKGEKGKSKSNKKSKSKAKSKK